MERWRKWICFGGAAVLTLTLSIMFGNVLTTYCQPMDAAVYDLSMDWEGEAVPDDWVYDQKGWTVFIQEGETVKELEPDGFGGFSTLDEPGQTFYFSRVIQEDLDSPTLRLDAADRTFSVFLDGTLVYTDCPELDNRIGYLQLPMLTWYREEKVLVTLPLNCAGKTLTIAQSTAPTFEDTHGRVWPCAVTLYCGFAYESALISESFQAAIPSTLSYLAGILLLALFVWQAFQGRLDFGMLCGTFTVFACLAARIVQTSFACLYFDMTPTDAETLCQNLALITLLVMLLCKLTGWRRVVLGAATAALGVLTPVIFVLSALEKASVSLMRQFSFLGVAGLVLALVFGFWEWNRQRWFFRLYCPLVLAGIAVYVIPTVLRVNPTFLTPAVPLLPLIDVSILAAFLSTVTERVHSELARRTEARLLVQRGELAQNSYEVIRRQHEQVMMLRHDMMKHFRLLRDTTSDEKTAAYLDELIGQNEEIRPVIRSGNTIVDVILNGKLSAAADAGIAVEITRMQAPDKLPLSDAELCSLMMNLLDNAVEAAAASGAERPYIKLDLGIKGYFFVLHCENSATLEYIQRKAAPGHGLGIKIIKQITARYGNLLETKYGADYYCVELAIPLG